MDLLENLINYYIKQGIVSTNWEEIENKIEKEKDEIKNNPNSIANKISLTLAQSSTETVQLLALLNEQQKIEQAKANAELIELIYNLLNGGNE